MQSLTDFLYKINGLIINPLIALLFVVALAVFLWGVFEYIKGSDDSSARELGARHITWGIIGLFIMVGVFGIINILLNTFGISEPSIDRALNGGGGASGVTRPPSSGNIRAEGFPLP